MTQSAPVGVGLNLMLAGVGDQLVTRVEAKAGLRPVITRLLAQRGPFIGCHP